MKKNGKYLYIAAVVVPLFFAYLVWDKNQDIFELSGNMRTAQFMDQEGQVFFPQDILIVEKHLDSKYLDKISEFDQSILVFAQRNPDLPRYSVFLKIIGHNPEQMKLYYDSIVGDFQNQTEEIIGNVKKSRESQLSSIEASIESIEGFKSQKLTSLTQAESYMNVYKQLSDLQNKREFLKISLSPFNIYGYYSMDTPKVIKKRDKKSFVLSLFGGALILIFFFCYIIFRTIHYKN